MPTYPDTLVTISGQRISWNRLYNNPVLLQRTIDTLVLQRLLSNRILQGRVDLSDSGALVYEQSEGILPNNPAEVVAPLSPYPKTTVGRGPLASLQVLKEGLGFDVADETVRYGRGDIIARDLMKVVNQQVTQNDQRTLSAIASAVTATYAASAAWNTTGADPFADVMLAGAQGDELNKGYSFTTAVMRPTLWAQALTRAKIVDRAPREGRDALLLTGRLFSIAGYDFWKSTNLPPGVNCMIFDPDQLGSIGYVDLQDGYSGSARPAGPGEFADAGTAGVQVKRFRLEDRDGVTVNTRLMQSPVIQNPDAAIKLTGV